MNVLRKKVRNITKTDMAAAILLFAAFVLLVITAFIRGTLSDEAFYITIPMRIINGDGLFTDEWHLSQLSAIVTYIPVRLFFGITGGTQGIILYMRLLFCIMQLGVAAVLYNTLRKYGINAVIASFTFMLFSVLSIRTLSYNTMGVALLTLLACTVYSVTQRPSRIKMFLSGSLVAMFILCQPTGLAFYAAYFTAVCFFFLSNKSKNKEIPYPFTLKSFAMTIAGIFPVFIFFLYLLLKNSDISTITECIPGILSDLEHMEISENLGVKTFSLIQFFKDMTLAAGIIPLILLVICTITGLFIKKYNRNIALIITITGMTVFFVIFFYRFLIKNGKTETDDINFLLLPLAIVGISLYALSGNKNNKVFVIFWCTGIAYALMMTTSSNLTLHSSVNGYLVASFASLIFAGDFLKEIKSMEVKNTLSKLSFSSIIVFCTIFSFVAIGNIVETACTFGAYKYIRMEEGIYANTNLPADQALIYTNIKNDAKKIKEIISPDDKIFVSENIPAMYLEGNFNMGAFSAWFIEEQLLLPETRDRFRGYYSIFPENIPDYIYVPAYFYDIYGLIPNPPRKSAEFPLALFEGTTEDIGSGLLIKVTGIKDEQG